MELAAKQETLTWAQMFRRKVLTDRQLWKAKFTTVALFTYTAFCLIMDRVAAQEYMAGDFKWMGSDFTKQAITIYKTG